MGIAWERQPQPSGHLLMLQNLLVLADIFMMLDGKSTLYCTVDLSNNFEPVDHNVY